MSSSVARSWAPTIAQLGRRSAGGRRRPGRRRPAGRSSSQQRRERRDQPVAGVGQHDRQARVGVVGHRLRDELEHDDALAAALDHRPAREVELAALDQRARPRRAGAAAGRAARRGRRSPSPPGPRRGGGRGTGSGPIASVHASSAQIRGRSSPLLSVAPRAQIRSSRIAGLYGGCRPQVERRGGLDVVVPDAVERARPVAQLARRRAAARPSPSSSTSTVAPGAGAAGRAVQSAAARRSAVSPPSDGMRQNVERAPRSSPRGARR